MTASPCRSRDRIKACMEFWGWSDGGAPGSVHHDDADHVVVHGDALDVLEAGARLSRAHEVSSDRLETLHGLDPYTGRGMRRPDFCDLGHI
jgi:hypothetical protein